MDAMIATLTEYVMQHEAPIRLTIFLGVFTVMALWEIVAPRRQLTQPKAVRWLNNISVNVLNIVIVRLLFPAAAVGFAIFVQDRQWGVLNLVELPLLLEIVIGVLLLDLAIYGQHVMVHYVPLFWRFHRMHHADLDLDVTSGARFHPVEIVFSMLVKFFIIVIVGPPVVAVFLFEAILNGAAMFNHSNVRIPVALDRILRWFIVTPDMHRVHHSVLMKETNSNFGFNFPWWDRLFRTYRYAPEQGQLGMTIGLSEFRDIKTCDWLPGMLKIPFIKI
ncbi:sterol desaturase family protein [Kaarinaea lacus]